MLDKLANALDKALDWLFVEPTKIPLFVDKADPSSTITNFGAIFVIAVVILMVAICFNKKLRDKIF